MSDVEPGSSEEEGYVQVGDEEEEEEDSSEDDQYNRQQFGIYQALPVPEGEGPACLNPEEATTVEEYLQAVRAQAARCPQVVRVEHPSLASGAQHGSQEQQQRQQQQLDGTWEGSEGGMHASSPAATAVGTGAEMGMAGMSSTGSSRSRGGSKQSSMAAYISQMVAAGALPSCPDWAKPSRGWLRQFVHEFAQLRTALAALSSQPAVEPPPFQVPKPFDSEGWERLCFGRLRAEELQSGPSSQAGGGTSPAGTTGVAGQGLIPTASPAGQTAMGKSGTGSPAKSLLPLVLRMDQVVVGTLLARHVTELQIASSMQPFCAQWIYALGAVLEKPVHADVSASLRALMKRVASMRAGLLQGPDDPQVPLLNVVAAMAGAYFGQDAELLSLLGPDADMP